MVLIQIFAIIFFLFAIIKVILRFRSGELSVSGMLIWILFWILISVIVITPNSTFYFANMLGIGRGADLVVYVSIVMLFFIIFKLMVRISKMERNMTKIVRKDAIESVKNIKE